MEDNEEVVKRSCTPVRMAVLAFGLCMLILRQAMAANVQHHPSPAVAAPVLVQPQTAQVTAQGGVTTYGTFGSQTLGQSFLPSPSTFGGGIQTGPSGNFLFAGRTDGSAAGFATPWRQIDSVALMQAAAGAAAQAAPNAVVAPSPAPGINAPANPNPGPAPASETNAGEGAAPAVGPAALMMPDVQGGPPRAFGSQPYVRSPELSALLTRIARSKGMLSGEGIDVYMSNRAARLEGVVRTPANRVLLANVLALEPEVRQIDNRLVPEGNPSN